MPKKNGFNLVFEMKQNNKTKNIPIIMLTGINKNTGLQFTSAGMQTFINANTEAFLEKQIKGQALKEVIQTIFEKTKPQNN